MKLTLKQELEKIFRKYLPTLSLHAVNDYRTQLEPLDAAGLVTKKVQLEVLLMLCQRLEALEEKVESTLYAKPTTTKPNAKKNI